jgi:hypothetical protein
MTIERERQRQAKHAVRVKPADYREILNSSDRTRTCDPGLMNPLRNPVFRRGNRD